jgi:hypothetical protein
MRNYIFLLILLLVLLFPVIVFSQTIPERRMGQAQQPSSATQTTIKPRIDGWHLDGYGAFLDSTRLDTSINYFHLYNPVFQESLTAAYLGNYALPYLNNDFFNRNPQVDFFFLQTRDAYLLTPQKVLYYNTRTPYTLLDFTQSEHRTRKNETRFNVLHSQNVNPYLNFTFRFDQARSAGQYINQESKNNFVTLYSSYTKDKLNIHGGFISNSIQNNENGGLRDDADLLDEPDTDFLKVNLTSVRSEFSNSYYYATGEYKLGRFVDDLDASPVTIEGEEGEESRTIIPKEFIPFASVIYSFELQRHSKVYNDQEDTINPFFDHAYFGPQYTKDSIRFNKLRNVVQLKQYENPDRKTSFGKRAFIGQEFNRISAPGPLLGVNNRLVRKYSNIYAGGGIFRQTGSFWRWNFDGRIFLLGRNAGQTELNGIVTKPLAFIGDSLAEFNLSGKIENLVPDYFQEEYYAHRIRWKNDLNMEQRMTVNGALKIPARNLELNANYALINNFIYNGSDRTPSQFGGQLLVLSAYADKDFNLGNFHFRTRLLWQKASNTEVLHLPDLSGYVSTNYRFVVSKVLFTQLGVDVRYNTEFYTDAYDPATGMFYLQNEEKVGNYPYIDAYANLRLKRTRVFFQMMNVGTEFIDSEYITTPGYPMYRRTFRLGVAWSFYD